MKDSNKFYGKICVATAVILFVAVIVVRVLMEYYAEFDWLYEKPSIFFSCGVFITSLYCIGIINLRQSKNNKQEMFLLELLEEANEKANDLINEQHSKIQELQTKKDILEQALYENEIEKEQNKK